MANVEFGTGKTVLILAIVAACFAVLWPKIFYPMLVSSPPGKSRSEHINGCCDVIFETDVSAMEMVSDMCGSIFRRHRGLDPTMSKRFHNVPIKEMVNVCRAEVMNVCGVDVTHLLNEKVQMGASYKQALEGIRSYNVSICLRENFGVNPASIGIHRRMRNWESVASRHFRQERPVLLRPEMMHPALRERGRTIPQSNMASKVPLERENANRPPPIPGMRPPMGGAGHVVPAPKVGATMSIVMPLYTIGIVIFSMYTIMKVFIRKTESGENYKNFHSDPEFRRVLFSEDYSNGCAALVREEQSTAQCEPAFRSTLWKSSADDATKLVMTAITGLLAEVDQQLNREGDTQTRYGTDLKEQEKSFDEFCTEAIRDSKKGISSKNEQIDILKGPANERSNISHTPIQENGAGDLKPKVKVMGMETMAMCGSEAKWSRPLSPSLGVQEQRSAICTTPPNFDAHNIILKDSLPTQSQLLVTDSENQKLALAEENDSQQPVILSGKVTLSLISLDVTLPKETKPEAHMTLRSTLKKEDQDSGKKESTNETLQDDLTTDYTTAIMSGDEEESFFLSKSDETIADLTSVDDFDTADDQEELEKDGHGNGEANTHECNPTDAFRQNQNDQDLHNNEADGKNQRLTENY